jgi:UDPglucose 6-dehydrogenase/GDP-mannose 6-dehydrogenase
MLRRGRKKLKISIVGTGYVGLVTGVGLASRGHEVICVDEDVLIVERLSRGESTIYEKDLATYLSHVRNAGLFRTTVNLEEALYESEMTIIAVGTPNRNGQIDLRHVRSVAVETGKILRDKATYHTVVIKSTVLPGTTDTIVLPILEQASSKKLGQFGLGVNPEFLREGNAIEDFMDPDRIVLGSDDPKSLQKLRELYADWRVDFVEVNTRTAEMIKYANNCLLAVQISTVNELANLAAELGGIDAYEVMRGIHLDKRWSPIMEDGTRISPDILSYLWPGCGFGGSCFPKDVAALHFQGKQLGLPMWILRAVLDTNSQQPLQVVNLLKKSLGELKGKRIAVMGLAFKPSTDDIRESPAFPIIRQLIQSESIVSVTDPVAYPKASQELEGLAISVYSDWRDAVRGADAVAILTAWHQYRQISATEMKMLMHGDIIIDARRIISNTNTDFINQFRIYTIGYSDSRQSSDLEC